MRDVRADPRETQLRERSRVVPRAGPGGLSARLVCDMQRGARERAGCAMAAGTGRFAYRKVGSECGLACARLHVHAF